MANWDTFRDRVGYFSIDRSLIEQEPFQVMRILSEVIVVGVEDQYVRGVIRYRAYSGMFDVVEQNQFTPEYAVMVHSKDGKFDRVEWKRLESNTKQVKTTIGNLDADNYARPYFRNIKWTGEQLKDAVDFGVEANNAFRNVLKECLIFDGTTKVAERDYYPILDGIRKDKGEKEI